MVFCQLDAFRLASCGRGQGNCYRFFRYSPPQQGDHTEMPVNPFAILEELELQFFQL